MKISRLNKNGRTSMDPNYVLNAGNHVKMFSEESKFWKPDQVLCEGNFDTKIVQNESKSSIKIINTTSTQTDINDPSNTYLTKELLSIMLMEALSKNNVTVSANNTNLHHNFPKPNQGDETDTLIPTKPLDNGNIDASPSAKEFVKFNQTAAQVLAFLNNETSSTLIDTIGNLDNIRLRFCSTLQEIVKNEEKYEKYLQKQTNSLPAVRDDSMGAKGEAVELPSKIEAVPEVEILPHIITVVHSGNGQTAEIQHPQKQPSTLRKLSQSVLKRQLANTLQNKSVAAHEAAKQDISKQLRHQIREIATKLALDSHKLKKGSKMCPVGLSSHNKLIRECSSKDNVIDSKRQKAPLKSSKNRKKDNGIAEDLFVPEQSINMIPTTQLNFSKESVQVKHRTCNFLYRERLKKQDLMLNADASVPDEKKVLPVQIKSKTEKKSRSALKIKQSIVESVAIPKSKSKIKPKYSDSLFFSKVKASKAKMSDMKALTEIILHERNACNSNSTVFENDNDEMINPTTPIHTVEAQTSTPSHFKTSLNCFDILDEITLADLKPFQPEYPRRDTIGTPPHWVPVEETFLYKLVYQTQNKEFSQLLQSITPDVHCSSLNCGKCTKLKKTKRPRSQHSENTVKHKCKSSTNSKASKTDRNEVAAKLRPYIFDPYMQYPTKPIIVMPVSVTYHNPNFNRRQSPKGTATGDLVTYLKKQKLPKSEYEQRYNHSISPPRIRDEYEVPYLTPQHSNRIQKNVKHLQASTSCELLFDVQKPTLEKNIQHVIEMIETNIVDTLSNPEKQTPQAFNAIENEILHILDNMRSNPSPLNLIHEVPNSFSGSQNINHFKPQTPRVKTRQNSMQKKKLSRGKSLLSSSEERFEVTASCQPNQNHSDAQAKNVKRIEKTANDKIPLNTSIRTYKTQTPRRIISRLTENKPLPQTVRNILAKRNKEKSADTIETESIKKISNNQHTIANNVKKMEQTANALEMKVIMSSRTDNTLSSRCSSRLSENKPSSQIVKCILNKRNTEKQKVIATPEDIKKLPSKQNTPAVEDNVIINKDIPKEKQTNVTINKDIPKEKQANIPYLNQTLQPLYNTAKYSENETKAVEIKADSYLTPFMQAVKQRRNDDHNYKSNSAKNILEFLDALSNITEDLPPKTFSNVVQVQYKTILHTALILCTPQIYYPIKIEYPVTIDICKKKSNIILGNGKNKIKILFKSKSFASVSLNRNNEINSNSKSEKKKKLLDVLQKIPTHIDSLSPPLEILQQLVNKEQEEHASFLNSIYSVVFTTMFFGLIFNYSCN